MKDAQRSFLQHIEALFDAGTIGERTDRQLLQLLRDRDRSAAELAFRVLVKRHGPLVFRASRAILRDTHAAEDAFQATFLVLARKAAHLWVHGSLEPWLLSVARRVAYRAARTRPDGESTSGRPLRCKRHPQRIKVGMIAMQSSTRN